MVKIKRSGKKTGKKYSLEIQKAEIRPEFDQHMRNKEDHADDRAYQLHGLFCCRMFITEYSYLGHEILENRKNKYDAVK